jgi:serine/threonine protein kinase
MGTPLYMSPEQFQGAKVDAKSDVYSLGATIYQLLAGRPPFLGANSAVLSAAHLYETPSPLTALVPEISEELAALVLSMLAKKPADRPSMEQVVKGLEQLGAPKATDSIPIVSRPSRDLDRLLGEGVDPLASTIGQIAVRTQRWLNNVTQRRAILASGTLLAVLTPLALYLHMRRELPVLQQTVPSMSIPTQPTAVPSAPSVQPLWRIVARSVFPCRPSRQEQKCCELPTVCSWAEHHGR